MHQFDKMMRLMLVHIPLGRDRSRNADVYEIPIDAIREFVANAFVHRDYGEDVQSFIQVELLDDRLEIKSPGRIPEGVDTQNVQGTVLRNPVIAAVFQLYKYTERAGTGIRKAQLLLKEHGLKPARIEQIKSPRMVKVTILRNQADSLPLEKPTNFWKRLKEGMRWFFS